VFNVRLALYTLLAVAIVGPAVYGWHVYRVRRTAQAFLERARALKPQTKRPPSAIAPLP